MANIKSTATLPSLPSMSKQRPMRPCACGCSMPTQRTWYPGHDARMKGLILRYVGGVLDLEAIAEWGGKETARMVTVHMKDKALMTRWGIVIPKEEAKAS